MRVRTGAVALFAACGTAGVSQAAAQSTPAPAPTPSQIAAPPQTLATPGATPAAAPAATPSAQDGAAPDKPTARPSAPITTRGGAASDAGSLSFPAAYFADMAPNTALDMVNRLPGFVLDTGDSTVRGFAGAAGNVLIDGRRPASKTDALDAALNRIPASDVERIELIRGGAPGIDMQGRTVLANVVRKTGDSRRATLQAGDFLFLQDGHTIPNGKVEYSRRIGERTIEASLSRYASLDDSVGDGRITTTGPTTASEQARTSGAGGGVGATGGYKGPLAGGELRANLKLEETYFKSGLSYGYPAPDQVVNDRARSRDGEVGLNYDRKFGKLELETTALQRLERDFSGERSTAPALMDDYSQVQKTGESIGRATLRYPLFETLTIEGGGELAYNTLDARTAFTQNAAPVPLPSANVHVDETRGEVFAQGAWTITPTLSLEAGARFEVSTISETGDAPLKRSFVYPKPRAVLSWAPDKDSQVRLRIEKKVGQLNFSDFASSADLGAATVNAGNPDLRPDQRWEYEISVERRFWKKGALVVTATHADIDDAVDLVPVQGSGGALDAPGNIGSGTADTLDVELTLPLDRLGIKDGLLKSSNLWRVSAVTDPETGVRRRISGERPWTQNAEFSQDLPRWRASWGVIYDRGWREAYYRLAEVQHFEVSPTSLEVYGEYKPRSDLSLRLELHNLVPYTFTRDRTIYDGPRAVSALEAREVRVIQSSQYVFCRIRKTFG